jgi:tetratricopeptide (TPR) repeat protein
MSASGLPLAPTTAAASASAAVAGEFELLQELGSGSSGQVYRARALRPYGDQPAGSEVAIKFLRQELAADERAKARLFAEGAVGQAVHNDQVARIFGVETRELPFGSVTFLVMQYVRGTTLRQFLARGSSAVEDLARRLGRDASRGLAALHRRGLVHRDIKPENLILTPDSELKIVDLGLARPFGSDSGSGSRSSDGPASPSRASGFGLAGSLAYSAPEILAGEPAGPRSDLYALGLVLFEVTTGKHPFAAATTVDAMLDAHLRQPPPRPSHLRAEISPFLEQVLLDLLQKNPDDRPRDASELARFFEQGERSEYWRRWEAKAPTLASRRRLQRMRRPAEMPFHGRRRERAALDQALAKARGNRGGTIVVAGPEGIGRRRLLDEALEQWLDGKQPPLLLGGEADSGLGHGEPFAGSLLDFLLRGDDRGSPNALPRAAAAAKTLFGLADADAFALAAASIGTSTEAPMVRADRLASALLKLCRPGQVLVLRVDRADELDTSGRLCVQRLAAAASSHPLLLLLAAGHDALELPQAERLDLVGLDEDDFVAAGSAVFRAGEDVEAYLRAAHQVLSGLPGNLIEALEHLARSGTLRGEAGDYHGLSPDAEPRPAPSHLERFESRVQSLDPPQRAVLTAAAVLGERCELVHLAALVRVPELAVLETLSVFRGRIVQAEGGDVRFRHRDFQQALLRSLPSAERIRLHAAAATMLTIAGASPLVIGMHRSMAFDHEGCLEPLLLGLAERVRAGSRRTALRLCGRLQVHLDQVPVTPTNEALRLRFLLLAAEARVNADQTDAAIKTFRAAEALARQLGDTDASAAARTGLANCELDSGRLLSAIALLESVHDDLRSRDEPAADALAAKAHGLHGRSLLYRGEATEGLRHLQAALQRLPDDAFDLRCHLRIDLARVEALSHYYTTALKTLATVEQERATWSLPRVRLRFHLYRGQIRAIVGQDDANQDLRYAIDESQRLALPTYGARAAVFLGEKQFWRRRDDEAMAMFQLARQLAVAAADRLGEGMARTYLVRLGEPDLGIRALVDDLGLPSLHCNLALARAGRGDADADDRELLAQLLTIADLPLSLHLRTLICLDRPASARSLARSIAERLPQRAARQRFLGLWGGSVRV